MDDPAPSSRLQLATRHQLAHDTFWSMAGGIAQALSQLLFLGYLARSGYPEFVGNYALALAIASPVQLFADRALRTLQVTRGSHGVALASLWGLRTWLGIGGILAATATVVTGSYAVDAIPLVVVFGLNKWVEGFSQTVYGHLQSQRHLKSLGQLQATRALMTTVVGILGVWTFGDLMMGLALQTIAFAIWLVACEVPALPQATLGVTHAEAGSVVAPAHVMTVIAWQPRHWWHLLAPSCALGLATFLVALQTSIPRLQLASVTSPERLGTFTVLCYLGYPATVFSSAWMQTMLPRLVDAYHRAETSRTRQVRWTIWGGTLTLALFTIVFHGVCGPQLLQAIFGPAYAINRELAWWLAIASAAGLLATVPASELTALQRYSLSSTLCGLTTLVCFIASHLWIVGDSLVGTTQVVALTSVVHGVTSWLARRVLDTDPLTRQQSSSTTRTTVEDRIKWRQSARSSTASTP